MGRLGCFLRIFCFSAALRRITPTTRPANLYVYCLNSRLIHVVCKYNTYIYIYIYIYILYTYTTVKHSPLHVQIHMYVYVQAAAWPGGLHSLGTCCGHCHPSIYVWSLHLRHVHGAVEGQDLDGRCSGHCSTSRSASRTTHHAFASRTLF